MRVLFISKECESIGIAQRVVEEGHQVKFWCKNPSYRFTGFNLVERVESWRPHIPWCDLVVCDTVGFGSYADVFKKHGKKLFSCSVVADMAELERDKGLELFQSCGIKTPESWFFDSPDDYRLSDAPMSNVALKPCGNIPTDLTYVCKSKTSVDYALHTYEENQKFLVQRLIDGIEISTEGWWNGRHWIKPFNHTIEQKRLLEGDLGPNTGCQGNIVWACNEDKIVRETLLKLTESLKRSDYVGPVDMNCIVNDEGIYALEPTFRMGYDAIEALCEGLKEPISDVLFEVAAGTKLEMNLSNDYLIAIRVSIPPWPESSNNNGMGLPILGLREENLKHLFLTDIYRDNRGLYRAAGGDGIVLKSTARGRTINEARRRAYRTISNLEILDCQYRRDIGLHVEEDIHKLKSMGYL